MHRGRTIAIGDIHGCAAALERVLEDVEVTSADTVITLGDYVDRGPDSRRVIEQLLELEKRCQLISLLGNHEIMMLSSMLDLQTRELWLSCGGVQTLNSYGGSLSDMPKSHRDFLASCLRYYETDEYLFLHANYAPRLPLDRQPESLLFWQHMPPKPTPPHQSGKIAFVGHTPQVSGDVLDAGHVVVIDTYCFGGGWLTAIDVDDRTIWQADRNGERRP